MVAAARGAFGWVAMQAIEGQEIKGRVQPSDFNFSARVIVFPQG
jgi:hypothetical protein